MSGGAADNPFSFRAVLALVAFGAAVFVALLWMIGAGMASGSTNDGGAHVGGKGLNGYAALADLLEKRGHDVRRTRTARTFGDESLLVLTPNPGAAAKDIAAAIRKHRYAGPTVLILPKWMAMRAPPTAAGETQPGKGWVVLTGASTPAWAEKLDSIGALDARVTALPAQSARWSGFALSGPLPQAKAVQTMASGRIIALIRDGEGQALAGFVSDGGYYPLLEDAAGHAGEGDDDRLFPVVVIAEPDLLNNYGLADRDRAMAALALFEATLDDNELPIDFDLMLSGHGRKANLLTLAFTPPFLAATLCLLLAGLVVGWRAFSRFGPPRQATRAIAFGKQALVANAAGLIRRARRPHLITAPYEAAARDRLTRVLALPRAADAAASDAAIDRALAARKPDATPFSVIAARLRAARHPHDILKAARDLHALERTLTR